MRVPKPLGCTKATVVPGARAGRLVDCLAPWSLTTGGHRAVVDAVADVVDALALLLRYLATGDVSESGQQLDVAVATLRSASSTPSDSIARVVDVARSLGVVGDGRLESRTAMASGRFR